MGLYPPDDYIDYNSRVSLTWTGNLFCQTNMCVKKKGVFFDVAPSNDPFFDTSYLFIPKYQEHITKFKKYLHYGDNFYFVNEYSKMTVYASKTYATIYSDDNVPE